MDIPKVTLYGKDEKGHFYKLPANFRQPWRNRLRALWNNFRMWLSWALQK